MAYYIENDSFVIDGQTIKGELAAPYVASLETYLNPYVDIDDGDCILPIHGQPIQRQPIRSLSAAQNRATNSISIV